MRHLKLSFHPLEPIRLLAAGIHWPHISILNGHLLVQLQISVCPIQAPPLTNASHILLFRDGVDIKCTHWRWMGVLTFHSKMFHLLSLSTN